MSFKMDYKRITMCFAAVFGQGFFLSFLILCNLGTDPCTFANRSVAAKIGLSFGNWQLIMNIIMLVIVILLKKSLIGFGTIFNMVLIGYYADFFCWLWGKLFRKATFTSPATRWPIFFITLMGFVVCVALYINANMGVSPYDAIPAIISEKVQSRLPQVPYAVTRVVWDGSAIVLGTLAGGVPIIGIILIALFLGPVISAVGVLLGRVAKNEKSTSQSSSQNI